MLKGIDNICDSAEMRIRKLFVTIYNRHEWDWVLCHSSPVQKNWTGGLRNTNMNGNFGYLFFNEPAQTRLNESKQYLQFMRMSKQYCKMHFLIIFNYEWPFMTINDWFCPFFLPFMSCHWMRFSKTIWFRNSWISPCSVPSHSFALKWQSRSCLIWNHNKIFLKLVGAKGFDLLIFYILRQILKNSSK